MAKKTGKLAMSITKINGWIMLASFISMFGAWFLWHNQFLAAMAGAFLVIAWFYNANLWVGIIAPVVTMKELGDGGLKALFGSKTSGRGMLLIGKIFWILGNVTTATTVVLTIFGLFKKDMPILFTIAGFSIPATMLLLGLGLTSRLKGAAYDKTHGLGDLSYDQPSGQFAPYTPPVTDNAGNGSLTYTDPYATDSQPVIPGAAVPGMAPETSTTTVTPPKKGMFGRNR